jgi:hypothetical protein
MEIKILTEKQIATLKGLGIIVFFVGLVCLAESLDRKLQQRRETEAAKQAAMATSCTQGGNTWVQVSRDGFVCVQMSKGSVPGTPVRISLPPATGK